MPVIVQIAIVMGFSFALVVCILSVVECDQDKSGKSGRISETIKALFGRRVAMKEREQMHRHRMELLKQLDEIAALERMANSDAGGGYAKLRDGILSELSSSLEATEATTSGSGPATKEGAERSRQ